MLDLRHYSAQPLTEVRSRSAKGPKPFKPDGLWLSVGDEWEQWCRDEEFHLEALAYCYKITLKPDANMLRLGSEPEILAFIDEYADGLMSIDWERLGQQHQGIIIAPYQWSLRLSTEAAWYYGWDCASGCVWDAEAIESVTLR